MQQLFTPVRSDGFGVELPGGARHFHQVQRVDDPDARP
jgi:hypothetical protein